MVTALTILYPFTSFNQPGLRKGTFSTLQHKKFHIYSIQLRKLVIFSIFYIYCWTTNQPHLLPTILHQLNPTFQYVYTIWASFSVNKSSFWWQVHAAFRIQLKLSIWCITFVGRTVRSITRIFSSFCLLQIVEDVIAAWQLHSAYYRGEHICW